MLSITKQMHAAARRCILDTILDTFPRKPSES